MNEFLRLSWLAIDFFFLRNYKYIKNKSHWIISWLKYFLPVVSLEKSQLSVDILKHSLSQHDSFSPTLHACCSLSGTACPVLCSAGSFYSLFLSSSLTSIHFFWECECEHDSCGLYPLEVLPLVAETPWIPSPACSEYFYFMLSVSQCFCCTEVSLLVNVCLLFFSVPNYKPVTFKHFCSCIP